VTPAREAELAAFCTGILACYAVSSASAGAAMALGALAFAVVARNVAIAAVSYASVLVEMWRR